MAKANDKGELFLENDEAIYVGICVSLAQAVVLGRTDMIAPVANTLRRRMLKMKGIKISEIGNEMEKCVRKDPTYTVQVEMVSHGDILKTEIVGAVEVPLPSKGRTGTRL